MLAEPLISVIVPVFNGAAYLPATLQSALAQGMEGVEILVIDDGSTDGTAQAARWFGDAVTYHRQENQGVSAARNRGIDMAKGRLLAFLDADDLWQPTFLRETLAALDRAGETTAGACTGWEYIDAGGAPIAGTQAGRAGRLVLRDYYYTNPLPIHAYLVKAEAVRAASGFNPAISGMEDWDLWLRTAGMGRDFQAIPGCLAQYRLHGKTGSRSADRMRAGRLAAAGNLVNCLLPEADRALAGMITARARLENAVELLTEGRLDEAAGEIRASAAAEPRAVEQDETLYALACVGQPIGRRGSGSPFDLTAAQALARSALERGGALTRRTDARLAWVLARLAYAQRDMPRTRLFLTQAARRDPALLKNPSLALTYMKSLLGAAVVQKIKGNPS